MTTADAEREARERAEKLLAELVRSGLVAEATSPFLCPRLTAAFLSDARELAEARARAEAAAVMRPEVLAFARLMEVKLRENDHKGGWQHDTARDLMERLREEGQELWGVIGGADAEDVVPASSRVNSEERTLIGREAADVANFAMMIADVCGALSAPTAVPTEPQQNGGETKVQVAVRIFAEATARAKPLMDSMTQDEQAEVLRLGFAAPTTTNKETP